MALILPLFLMLTVGVVDGARVFTAQIALTNAAREAALFASRSSGYLKWCRDATGGGTGTSVPCPAGTSSAWYAADPSNIAARVWAEVTGLNASLIVIEPPTCDGAPCSDSSTSALNVTVRLRYPMTLALPGLGAIWGDPVQVTASATAKIFR